MSLGVSIGHPASGTELRKGPTYINQYQVKEVSPQIDTLENGVKCMRHFEKKIEVSDEVP